MFFTRVLFDSDQHDQFENAIGITQINALCIIGKFILSDQGKKAAKLQVEVDQEFYKWLSKNNKNGKN